MSPSVRGRLEYLSGNLGIGMSSLVEAALLLLFYYYERGCLERDLVEWLYSSGAASAGGFSALLRVVAGPEAEIP